MPDRDSLGRFVAGRTPPHKRELGKHQSIVTTWRNMRQRCRENQRGYENINVCKRWLSFDNFFEDMKDGWLEGLSIDRIDNSKGYSPDNCRWATREEQANNTRQTPLITYLGIKKSVSQWSRYFGIKRTTLRNRLYRGLTMQEATKGGIYVS